MTGKRTFKAIGVRIPLDNMSYQDAVKEATKETNNDRK